MRASITRLCVLYWALGASLNMPGIEPARAVAESLDYQNVTTARLVAADKDDGWLMYRRDYASSGYAPFDVVNTGNVGKLKVVFDYESHLRQGHEAPPIVNGRFMFVTTPMDHLVAMDAANGAVMWEYAYPVDKKALRTVCCDVVNRGVALYDDLVFMGTLGNHVVAVEARTGRVRWDTALAPPGVGYFISGAPLVVNGLVIIGTGGGEYGARGFIVALSAVTGKVKWKTYTTAAPGTPAGRTWPAGAYLRGGGAAWLTGSFDQDSHSVLWGVGNPAPWLATLRPGANLYTDSVLALSPYTGAIKWYYQWTANDTWDYDGTNESVLVDITYEGRSHKALVHADRNGWFYAVDRDDGRLIYAKPFVHVTSIVGVRDGHTVSDPSMRPTAQKGVFTCPSYLGGKNWWPISVSPQTHLAYIPTLHACMDLSADLPAVYKRGSYYVGEWFELKRDPTTQNWGSVQALELDTGEQKWSKGASVPFTSGILATAGGLVFSGRSDGHLVAFDARTGVQLWISGQLSSGVVGVPTTYIVAGRQYVAIWAGWGGGVGLWGGDMADAPGLKGIKQGGHLYVFGL